jgi:hypothetical protein
MTRKTEQFLCTLRSFSFISCLCLIASSLLGQQFVNKNSDVVSQIYRAVAPADTNEKKDIVKAMLEAGDKTPPAISLSQCANESLTRLTSGTVVPAVDHYIVHVGEWTVNEDGTYSLVTSRWSVYQLLYKPKDKANQQCTLRKTSLRASGDPLLYAVKNARLIGINHFDYRIHKQQVLVAYKAYSTPAQAENVASFGSLASALLGVATPSLGLNGVPPRNLEEDLQDTFVVAHNVSGLDRFPFDFNAAPFVNVTPSSLTLSDAHVGTQAGVSILSPEANEQLDDNQQEILASTSSVAAMMTLLVDGAELHTSIAAAVNSGTQIVTPASMAGITAGSMLGIDTGTNQEIVNVMAVNGSTFAAAFTKPHMAGVIVLLSPKTKPPYRFQLDTTTLLTGPHTLAVATYDAKGSPTFSAPLPVTKSSLFETCDGQPYDQILPLSPTEIFPDVNNPDPNAPKNHPRYLTLVKTSIPSGFGLRYDKTGHRWHLCGYPYYPGTYNVLIKDSTDHDTRKLSSSDSTGIVTYAALSLTVQSASGGGGGGGGASQGASDGGPPSMSSGKGNGGKGGGGGQGGSGGANNASGGSGQNSGQNNGGQSGTLPNQQGALPSVTVVDCSALSSSSPCTFNRTFRSLDREYWDFGIGVTAPGVREPIYASATAAPTVKTHTDAYGLLDLYPAAHWFTKEQPFPHFVVGLPVTGQPFYRPLFGIGENVTAWTRLERKGFPLRINVFAGLVYMQQQFVVGNPNPATAAQSPLIIRHGRSLKGVYGFEVPVAALVSTIKGAGGSSNGSQSGKSTTK